jgi:hypothetical protein
MRFVRAMPHGEGAANLRTYECKECGVAATPAEDSAPTGKLQLGSIIASDNSPITNALLDHGLFVSAPDPQTFQNADQRDIASNRRQS